MDLPISSDWKGETREKQNAKEEVKKYPKGLKGECYTISCTQTRPKMGKAKNDQTVNGNFNQNERNEKE